MRTSSVPVPTLRYVRRVAGASRAVLLVAAEGDGHRRMVGAARAAIVVGERGVGVQRRSGAGAAALMMDAAGLGVADDVEALLTLYAAAIAPTVRATY